MSRRHKYEVITNPDWVHPSEKDRIQPYDATKDPHCAMARSHGFTKHCKEGASREVIDDEDRQLKFSSKGRKMNDSGRVPEEDVLGKLVLSELKADEQPAHSVSASGRRQAQPNANWSLGDDDDVPPCSEEVAHLMERWGDVELEVMNLWTFVGVRCRSLVALEEEEERRAREEKVRQLIQKKLKEKEEEALRIREQRKRLAEAAKQRDHAEPRASSALSKETPEKKAKAPQPPVASKLVKGVSRKAVPRPQPLPNKPSQSQAIENRESTGEPPREQQSQQQASHDSNANPPSASTSAAANEEQQVSPGRQESKHSSPRSPREAPVGGPAKTDAPASKPTTPRDPPAAASKPTTPRDPPAAASKPTTPRDPPAAASKPTTPRDPPAAASKSTTPRDSPRAKGEKLDAARIPPAPKAKSGKKKAAAPEGDDDYADDYDNEFDDSSTSSPTKGTATPSTAIGNKNAPPKTVASPPANGGGDDDYDDEFSDEPPSPPKPQVQVAPKAVPPPPKAPSPDYGDEFEDESSSPTQNVPKAQAQPTDSADDYDDEFDD